MNMDKKKNKFIIRYVNHSIANRYPNMHVELHRKLLREEFKDLRVEILEHEMSHDDGPYTKHDLNLDMGGFSNRKLYWKFLLTTPSAWIQFSPITRARGKWYYDLPLIFLWLIVIAFGVLWFAVLL